jgi:hypothetical protein
VREEGSVEVLILIALVVGTLGVALSKLGASAFDPLRTFASGVKSAR